MGEWAPEESSSSSAGRWVNPKDWEEVTEDKKPVKRFRFRVLSSVSTGAEVWGDDGKPYRAKTAKELSGIKPRQDGKFGPDKVKDVWAFVVLDVDADTEKVWTVHQATVRNALKSVTAEWGDPFGYDLVCKQGKSSDGKTIYSMTAHPSGKVPLGPAQAERWAALKAAGFDLEALWTGGDPFPSSGASGGGAADASSDIPF